MSTALVDFEVEYDGEIIFLKAGLDHVSDRHELVYLYRYPERFGPTKSALPILVRSRVAPRERPANRLFLFAPAPAPRRRFGPERVEPTIKFTPHARRRLLDEIGRCDGLEVGGGLFGYERSGMIVVNDVGGLAPSAEPYRTSHLVEVPPSDCVDIERSLRGLPSVWVGDYHTHPNGGPPSETDKQIWKRRLANFGSERAGCFVGLVATPNPDDPEWGWCEPTLHASVARMEDGQAVVKPATILT